MESLADTNTGRTEPDHIEIRIHGVSGTPPESMLRNAHAKQIAGDDKGRIYVVDRDESSRTTSAPLVEAYHWGSYTAGSWVQGLWFILIPFGILNSAQYMLPSCAADDRIGRASHAVCGAMLRLIGLCMTGVFTFAAVYILADLLAWQALPRWIATIDEAVLPRTTIPAHTFAVTVAFMLAVAIILGLSLLAGRSASRATEADAEETPSEFSDTLLRRPGFLAGDPSAPVLRALHQAFALLFAGYLAAGLWEPWAVTETATKCGLVAVVILVVILGDPEHSAALSDSNRLIENWWLALRPLTRWFCRGSFVLFAVAASVPLVRHAPITAGTQLRQFDSGAVALLTYSLAALIILLIAVGILAWRTREANRSAPASFRPYARGTAAYWVASAGFFLGLGFSAAAAEGVAQLTRASGKSPILERISYSWGVTLLVMLVVAAIGWALYGYHGERRARHVFQLCEQLAPDWTIPPSWQRRAASAVGIARLKNCLPPVLITFGVLALVLTVAAGHEEVGIQNLWRYAAAPRQDTDGQLPTLLRFLSQDIEDGEFNLIVWLGTWILIAVAARLVVLGKSAVTGQTTRRVVNTVWDVFCFWPHSAHPFAPPPYSTYVVLDIRNRIEHHLNNPLPSTGTPHRRPLVVCAHSQGSLIAFAALIRLTTEQRKQVALLTYGSQLQVIFPRAFPGYINHSSLESLFQQLDGCWVNLYRDTDPLAGPVLSWKNEPGSEYPRQCFTTDGSPPALTFDAAAGVQQCGPDWLLLDPPPADPGLQQAAMSKLYGHSDFAAHTAWPEAVDKARSPVPPPGTDIT